jgi:1,6-anhydro-N-acetylmuramate kinase
MKPLFAMVLIAGSISVTGCATQTQPTTAQWKQKASTIPVGTPKAKVEQLLPPVGIVLDLRSGPGAGPVAYWVDDATSVKLRYDKNERLAEPVIVESKRRPEANK